MSDVTAIVEGLTERFKTELTAVRESIIRELKPRKWQMIVPFVSLVSVIVAGASVYFTYEISKSNLELQRWNIVLSHTFEQKLDTHNDLIPLLFATSDSAKHGCTGAVNIAKRSIDRLLTRIQPVVLDTSMYDAIYREVHDIEALYDTLINQSRDSSRERELEATWDSVQIRVRNVSDRLSREIRADVVALLVTPKRSVKLKSNN